jgi:hypothetical protein
MQYNLLNQQLRAKVVPGICTAAVRSWGTCHRMHLEPKDPVEKMSFSAAPCQTFVKISNSLERFIVADESRFVIVNRTGGIHDSLYPSFTVFISPTLSALTSRVVARYR